MVSLNLYKNIFKYGNMQNNSLTPDEELSEHLVTWKAFVHHHIQSHKL